MTDKEKLELIIAQLCYGNKAEFARIIEISPQTVTNWMNRGVSKDGLTSIQKSFPSINPEWLLTGKGEMILSTAENSKTGTSHKKDRVIPFYDAETTGGYNGVVSSSSDVSNLMGYIQPGDWFDGRETAAIRHVGDSMVEYPNGCVLAVREVRERRLLVPGHNYVIETDEYRVTKRVQRGSSADTITLYSSNMEKYDDGRLVYEPFDVHLEDIRHIYRVLGYIVNQAGDYRLIKP